MDKVRQIPSEMLNHPEVMEIIRRSNRTHLIEVISLSLLVDVLGDPNGKTGVRKFLTDARQLGGALLVLNTKSNAFVVGGHRAKMDHSKSALVVLGGTNTICKDVDCSEQLRKDNGCADPNNLKDHLRTMVRFR